MKVQLEIPTMTYRGLILESETSEDRQVLMNIWLDKGRPVALANLGRHSEGTLQLTIAPTPPEQ